ncbi:HET domain-containing protein [Trichoderma evansii]
MGSNFEGITPGCDLTQDPLSPELLCEDCANLDLEKALVKREYTKLDIGFGRWGYFNTWAVDVGHRYRVMRTTNCNLCKMLFKSRVDEGNSTIDDGVDWIRAVSFLKFSGLVRDSDFWHQKDFPVLMLFSNKNYDLFKNIQRIMDLIQQSGSAALQQFNQQPVVPFLLKAIPPVFDLGAFRDWFGYCNSNHGLLCHSTKSDLCGTRVIDCQEQRVVEYGPGMPYVALSYVWGQPKAQHDKNNGKQLPTQLSLLMRDAMEITLAMGFRYLWVDHYCIDQDDPTVVHQQIGQMGAIYGNAEVTIIAAAGQDEDYGLPGVGRNRPATRTTAHIGEVAVVWTPKNPQEAIKSSCWSTRGWTFQEALLSRRRLVFTEQQVYFECNAMNISESLNIPLDSLHIKDKSKSHEGLRSGVFGRNRAAEFDRYNLETQGQAEALSQYLSNVEEYSARKLTFAEDSLNAFQGIARQLWYRKHAVHNIWGLSYPALPKERGSGFAHSLTWRHTTSCWDLSQSPHRRPQFPSWSWAGWEGEVRYEMTSAIESRFENLIEDISFENQIGAPIALEMIAPKPDDNCIFPVMRLTAAVVPSKLISFIPNATSNTHWQIGGFEADISLSHGSVSKSQFAEDVHDGHKWQFVCIGALYGFSFFMILKIHDSSGLWERAGFLHLDCDRFYLTPMMQTWEYKSFRIR